MGDIYRVALLMATAAAILNGPSSVTATSGRLGELAANNNAPGEDYNDRASDVYGIYEDFYGARPPPEAAGRSASAVFGDILRGRDAASGHVIEAKRTAGWSPSICGQWDDWCAPGSNNPGLHWVEEARQLWRSVEVSVPFIPHGSNKPTADFLRYG